MDKKYVDYLKKHEDKIMNLGDGEENEKFVFGAVVEINFIKYYAPISSIKSYQLKQNGSLEQIFKKRTFPILDENKIIALVRIDFMFPIDESSLKILDITKLSEPYKRLVEKEYFYCKSNKEEIRIKAEDLYKKAVKPTHFLNQLCANFKLLELKYNEWVTEKVKQSK